MPSLASQRFLISLSLAIHWGVTSSAALLAAPIDPSSPQEPQSSLLELRFGATTIVVEKKTINWISGYQKKPDQLTESTITVPNNGSVFFTPPFEVPRCLEIGQVLLTHQTIEPTVRQPLFVDYTPMASEFRGISQLRPPSGRPILDLYQFEASDLKDFWGEQITFYREPPTINVRIQLTRDTHLRVPATAERCFFEQGEATIWQLISFVTGKIKK
ncbi:hypothetical protein AB7M16_004203 [Bradyrhizobium sp. USDA 372]